MVKRVQDLRCYQAAERGAEGVFNFIKSLPRDELFKLGAQGRDSARSVCANMAEAWGQRRYPAAFVSKLTISLGEAEETRVWLDLAAKCGYMSPEAHTELRRCYDQVVGSLIKMINNPTPWCGPSTVREEQAEYEADS